MANSPAHLYSTYVKAFNVRDVEAILACYELTRLVTRSGRIARGSVELGDVFNRIFRNKPQMKLEIKIISASDDLALIIVEWTTTTDTKSGSGTAIDILRRQHDGTWKIVLDNVYGVEQSA